jgi:cell division protein FtsL
MSLESLMTNVPKAAALDFLASLEKALETFQANTAFEINLNISQHGGLDAQILKKTKENYDAAKSIEEVSKPALVASSQG